MTKLQLRRYKRIRQRAYRNGGTWGCTSGQRWQEIVRKYLRA